MKNSPLLPCIFLTAFLSLAVVSIYAEDEVADLEQTGDYSDPKARDLCKMTYLSRMGLGFKAGNGIGYPGGYLSGSLFMTPKWRGRSQAFSDLRVHVLNNGMPATNVGFGLRALSQSQRSAFGLNGFYDYRRERKLPLHQFGIGAEFLTNSLDARLNAYIPFATETRKGKISGIKYLNHSIYSRIKVSGALPSIQGGLGWSVPWGFERIRLYLSGGAYYLFPQTVHKKVLGDAWGGEGKASFRIVKGLSASISTSYDRIYGGLFQVAITWNSSPVATKFSRSEEEPICRANRNLFEKMSSGVDRRDIISLDRHTEWVNLLESGQSAFYVNSVAAPGGNGDYDAPFHLLASAQHAAKEGDVIFVYPGMGVYDEGIALKEGQILHGTGMPYEAIGHTLPPFTPDQMPVIGSASGSAITLASRNQIRGIVIDSPFGCGLEGTDINGGIIDRVTIRKAGEHAISLANLKGTFEVRDSSIEDWKGNGLLVRGANCVGEVRFSGSHMKDGGDGADAIMLDLTGSSCLAAMVSGSRFSGVGSSAIRTRAAEESALAVRVENSLFMDAAGKYQDGGIAIQGRDESTTHFEIIKCQLSNLKRVGDGEGMISIDGSHHAKFTGSIEGNTLVGSNHSGVQFDLRNHVQQFDVCVSGNRIDGVARHGIDFLFTNSTLSANPGYISVKDNQVGSEKNGLRVFTNTSGTVVYLDVENNTFVSEADHACFIRAQGTTTQHARFVGNMFESGQEITPFVARTNAAMGSLNLEMEKNKAQNNKLIGEYQFDVVSGGIQLLDGENFVKNNEGLFKQVRGRVEHIKKVELDSAPDIDSNSK